MDHDTQDECKQQYPSAILSLAAAIATCFVPVLKYDDSADEIDGFCLAYLRCEGPLQESLKHCI